MAHLNFHSIRVAHSVSSLTNKSAGPSYSVPSLALMQAELGATVEIHSLDGAPEHKTAGLTDIRHSRDFSSLPVLENMGISGAMKRSLISTKCEVLHTHGLWMMPNIYRPRGVALVIAPRGMLTPIALSFSSRKKALFRFLFQDRALADASLFHATAESEYDDIRSFGLSQPVAVIPNGIDLPDAAACGPVGKGRSVLSLGRIHPKKGLKNLIQAWKAIEPNFPDWRLRIVGPDDVGHATELSRLVRELGLNKVSIEAPVFGAAKTEMMASADIFVLPTLSENFAMTVAESLAVGVPVISTKGAPWSGLETNGCGWWIDHGPEPMASALRCAMSQPSETLWAMGMKGREWMARDYSWERVAGMTLDAYRWVLKGGERPNFVRVD